MDLIIKFLWSIAGSAALIAAASAAKPILEAWYYFVAPICQLIPPLMGWLLRHMTKWRWYTWLVFVSATSLGCYKLTYKAIAVYDHWHEVIITQEREQMVACADGDVELDVSDNPTSLQAKLIPSAKMLGRAVVSSGDAVLYTFRQGFVATLKGTALLVWFFVPKDLVNMLVLAAIVVLGRYFLRGYKKHVYPSAGNDIPLLQPQPEIRDTEPEVLPSERGGGVDNARHGVDDAMPLLNEIIPLSQARFDNTNLIDEVYDELAEEQALLEAGLAKEDLEAALKARKHKTYLAEVCTMDALKARKALKIARDLAVERKELLEAICDEVSSDEARKQRTLAAVERLEELRRQQLEVGFVPSDEVLIDEIADAELAEKPNADDGSASDSDSSIDGCGDRQGEGEDAWRHRKDKKNESSFTPALEPDNKGTATAVVLTQLAKKAHEKITKKVGEELGKMAVEEFSVAADGKVAAALQKTTSFNWWSSWHIGRALTPPSPDELRALVFGGGKEGVAEATKAFKGMLWKIAQCEMARDEAIAASSFVPENNIRPEFVQKAVEKLIDKYGKDVVAKMAPDLGGGFLKGGFVDAVENSVASDLQNVIVNTVKGQVVDAAEEMVEGTLQESAVQALGKAFANGIGRAASGVGIGMAFDTTITAFRALYRSKSVDSKGFKEEFKEIYGPPKRKLSTQIAGYAAGAVTTAVIAPFALPGLAATSIGVATAGSASYGAGKLYDRCFASSQQIPMAERAKNLAKRYSAPAMPLRELSASDIVAGMSEISALDIVSNNIQVAA